ncbi:MAG: sigma-70 family RNA polymerase sigma factor [Mangrovibacterium sp.]
MKLTSININKLNRRDAKEFKRFFKSFYPSICLFAQKFIDSELAEDIAQDAFLLFWESDKQFESLDNLKGFLYLAAKNKCLNQQKQQLGRDQLLKDNWNDESLFYEFILEEETYQIIHQAIQDIAPQGRKIIELSLHGYKNPEIAEALNISINTVKTHKANAYRILREKLKGEVFILFLLEHILS